MTPTLLFTSRVRKMLSTEQKTPQDCIRISEVYLIGNVPNQVRLFTTLPIYAPAITGIAYDRVSSLLRQQP